MFVFREKETIPQSNFDMLMQLMDVLHEEGEEDVIDTTYEEIPMETDSKKQQRQRP